MGEVYRARDLQLRRDVALKVLPAGALAEETARKRFRREAYALSRVSHPHVATLHDFDSVDNLDFLVMELVEGPTLRATLAHGPMPEKDVVRLGAQLVRGLAAAHEQGVIHRDLKPSNVRLTSDGLVKVLDFGVAYVERPGQAEFTTETSDHPVAGTPQYMSPEQLRGKDVDERTDVYGAGAVLYHMATGSLPFGDLNGADLVAAILKENPRRPREANPAISVQLEGVIEKATDKDPGLRYQTAKDLLVDLERLAAEPGRRTAARRRARGAAEARDRAAPTPTPAVAGSGERRQVTVAVIEIPDDLTLVDRLDPEELHELFHEWHGAASSVVTELDGHVASAEQGRLVACFGYPVAHEDDARRAVRAARRVVQTPLPVAASSAGEATLLHARAAVDTGVLVVHETTRLSTRPWPLVSRAAALASRIVEAAPTGAVLVSAETRRLVETAFAVESFGHRAWAGLPGAAGVARVLHETASWSRPGDAPPVSRSPLFGRDQELALVLARWEQAREGQGQLVLLTGEPGIGKTRLLAEALDRLRTQVRACLVCRGSPYHANDALGALRSMLEQEAGFVEGEAAPAKQARLADLLRWWGASPETIAVVAAALSLSPAESKALQGLTPQRQKQKTIDALAQVVLSLAAREPVLFAVEDLHWLDPTSLETLRRVVDGCASSSILLLATARPGVAATWAEGASVTGIALGRLDRRHSERLATHVAGQAELDAERLEQVVARTDGVPLFIEELTRALVESPGARAVTIPASLQESLAARLDRLGSAKAVAQTCAVVGREFALTWIEALSPLDASTLQRELRRLVDAGLVHQKGAPPALAWSFKHALVHEAAYASLLGGERRQCHARLAELIEDRFAETAEREPHLVAHHYGAAGLADKAVDWWSRAATRAAQRFANREAAASYRQALACLKQTPPGPERDRRELGLQMELCGILPSVFGYGAPETEQAWLQAQEMCDRLGPAADLFWVYHGLWSFNFGRARLPHARERAQSLLALGRSLGDSLSVLDGHFAIGVNLTYEGEPAAALQHLDAGIAAGAAEPNRAPCFMMGMEPGITTPAFSTVALWVLGRPDQALARAEQAAQQARRLGHPLTLSFALHYVVWAHVQRGEAALALERGRELAVLCEQHELFFGAVGDTLLGWAVDQREPVVPAWFAGIDDRAPSLAEDGARRVALGVRAYRETGSLVNLTHMLSLLTVAHARRGRLAEARATLHETMALAAETGERWIEPELQRLRGELAVATGAGGDAEACFRTALQAARAQGAASLELRAATSLGRTLRATGRSREGRDIVAACLGAFSEGLGTGDVLAARALVEALA